MSQVCFKVYAVYYCIAEVGRCLPEGGALALGCLGHAGRRPRPELAPGSDFPSLTKSKGIVGPSRSEGLQATLKLLRTSKAGAGPSCHFSDRD